MEIWLIISLIFNIIFACIILIKQDKEDEIKYKNERSEDRELIALRVAQIIKKNDTKNQSNESK